MLMDLTQVLGSLGLTKEQGSLIRHNQSSTLVGGKWQDTQDAAVDIEFFTQPDDTDVLKPDTEGGSEIIINRMFWVVKSDFDIDHKDKIVYPKTGGDTFLIREVNSHAHGNYTYVRGFYRKKVMV